jgi:hypothetical protein
VTRGREIHGRIDRGVIGTSDAHEPDMITSTCEPHGLDRALRRAIWVAMLLLNALTASDARAIIRRHDVADSEYIVDPGELPQVIDLLEPGDCLATLIDPEWLITAAHCTEGLTLPHAVPIAGTSRAVAAIVDHPGYDGWDHDVSLLRLEEPVTDVAPLPLYRDTGEVGKTVILVGRGDTGTGLLGQSAATLDLLTRRATNVVTSADDLWLRWTFDAPDSEAVMDLEGISGDGDSGGPALIVIDGVLQVAGISAWQDADDPDLGRYGVVEVYSRVSTELAFIEGTIGGMDGEIPDGPPAMAAATGEGCSVAAGTGPGWAPILLVPWLFARRRSRR